MPSLLMVRKMEVTSLVAGENELVRRLYAILDGMEWFTITPLYLGLFGILAVGVVAKLLGINGDPNEWSPLLVMGLALLSYGLAALLLTVLFTPFQGRQIEKLHRMRKLYSDECLINALETLDSIDPSLIRNVSIPLRFAGFGKS